MLVDYHIHTEHSDDSVVPIKSYIKRALALGFEELCFTNHIDYEVPDNASCDVKQYKKDFDEAKKEYEGKIRLKFGMEFGMQVHTIDKFQKTFDENDFDFIILSCHALDNLGFWNGGFQEGKTQKEFNERYYNEILNFIKKYKDYSTLGHLDVIRRYDKTYYPFEKVKDIIAEILKIVIADGKGIEVNTSSFRYKIPDFMPSENILKLYKDLGGEIITVGSDSHDILHLGSNFDKAREELIKLGYKHFYTFDKMKPIVHDLKDGV